MPASTFNTPRHKQEMGRRRMRLGFREGASLHITVSRRKPSPRKGMHRLSQSHFSESTRQPFSLAGACLVVWAHQLGWMPWSTNSVQSPVAPFVTWLHPVPETAYEVLTVCVHTREHTENSIHTSQVLANCLRVSAVYSFSRISQNGELSWGKPRIV